MPAACGIMRGVGESQWRGAVGRAIPEADYTMRVVLASPRGFCAGVERAIKCVERALDRYGAPVYVLNDIVHNAAVVSSLRAKGAVFVKDLREVPKGAHLLFSAHGVSPERWQEARERDLEVVDATCPLVEKVHREARRFAAEGYTVILIGEAGHDEVIGTRGQAPDHIRVALTEEDVDALELDQTQRVAYLTQTTLSAKDSRRVVERLRAKFPGIVGPRSDDICYATQNRQAAVNSWASEADLVLVVGDEASANSRRLAEICERMGRPCRLIRDASMIDDDWLDGAETILLTAGASAPESLVEGVLAFLRTRGQCDVEERVVTEENVHFRLPQSIMDDLPGAGRGQ